MNEALFNKQALKNPERVARVREWIAALRSGKYQQGSGYLKDGEGAMCCLGVYCDLVMPGGWEGHEHPPGTSADPTTIIYEKVLGGEYYLGNKGRLQLGLTKEGVDKLASLNDNGFTFSEIADTIERALQAGVAA